MLLLCGSYTFFFQAEDGIRDLVRSRGLGDVYKRQYQDIRSRLLEAKVSEGLEVQRKGERFSLIDPPGPVSYTHLTLPTSDLV